MTKYMTAGRYHDKMLRMEKSNDLTYPACHAPTINNQLLQVGISNMDLTGGTYLPSNPMVSMCLMLLQIYNCNNAVYNNVVIETFMFM